MAFYLVTGGAGFIGSHLVAELVSRAERVRVLDNFSTGHRENLAPAAGQAEIIEGDLRDYQAVLRACQGVDYVLHQGALPSVQRSVDDPMTSHQVNVDGTVNVLEAARQSGVKRVVYASSSSVYGDKPTLPKHEEMAPAPKSPYAASKLAGEYYMQVFHQVFGLETAVLRYFNVFGPRQDPKSHYAGVIPRFIACLLNGGTPVIYGDGLQSRDFTYVANVVAANLLAATVPEATGQVMNIACGERHSLLELLELVGKVVGRQVQPQFEQERRGDVKHSLADISRARQYLGYQPQVSFEEGICRTVEWAQEGS